MEMAELWYDQRVIHYNDTRPPSHYVVFEYVSLQASEMAIQPKSTKAKMDHRPDLLLLLRALRHPSCSIETSQKE